MKQEGTAPGQVDHDDGDIVGGALVDGRTRQHTGGDLGGGVAGGAALLRPAETPLRQGARFLQGYHVQRGVRTCRLRSATEHAVTALDTERMKWLWARRPGAHLVGHDVPQAVRRQQQQLVLRDTAQNRYLQSTSVNVH